MTSTELAKQMDFIHRHSIYGLFPTTTDIFKALSQEDKANLKEVILTLPIALAFADHGYFLTHQGFSKEESLHSWNNSYYYEDGANITEDYLYSEEIFKKGWKIKYLPEEIDINKLEQMHKSRYTLINRSYEECVINKKE